MNSVSDIWRNINIGFYTYRDRKRIPTLPGTYAWYCPLDIKTSNFNNFISMYKTIFEYDFQNEMSIVKRNTITELPWKILNNTMKLSLKDLSEDLTFSGKTLKELWEIINNNPESLKKFRVALLQSSILLPPLYVGKTQNLSQRYRQHCEYDISSSQNCFKKRFMNHMNNNNINIDFEDLIFFALPMEILPEHSENLLEEIIKLFAQPIYSIK